MVDIEVSACSELKTAKLVDVNIKIEISKRCRKNIDLRIPEVK
jgi:hypothetical protein